MFARNREHLDRRARGNAALDLLAEAVESFIPALSLGREVEGGTDPGTKPVVSDRFDECENFADSIGLRVWGF